MAVLRKVIPQYATQTYTPGGSMTVANPGYAAGGGAFDIRSLLDMIRRPKTGPVAAMHTTAPPRVISSGPTPREREVANAEASARIAQLQAISGTQPLRMVSGPGIVSGYQPDTLAMTGAQRQVFLPKESQMTAVGAADDNYRQQRNQEGMEDFMNTTDRRRQIANRGGQPMSMEDQADFQAALEAARKRRGVR